MIKAILLLDDIGYIAIIVVLSIYCLSLRRRMKGIDDPVLWLPRKERREHARKLLKREDEVYEEQMIARLSEAIRGNQPNIKDKKG